MRSKVEFSHSLLHTNADVEMYFLQGCLDQKTAEVPHPLPPVQAPIVFVLQ
jgi:hypothetical protein